MAEEVSIDLSDMGCDDQPTEDELTQIAKEREAFHNKEKKRLRYTDKWISGTVYISQIFAATFSVLASSTVISEDAREYISLIVGIVVAASTSLLGVQSSMGLKEAGAKHAAAENIMKKYSNEDELAPNPKNAIMAVDDAMPKPKPKIR